MVDTWLCLNIGYSYNHFLFLIIIKQTYALPSGKLTYLWKMTMLNLMGKCSMLMAIFNSKLLVSTRGYCRYCR